jgi:neutral ceramidase
MKAGFYASCITPSYGMEQPGGYGKSYIKRVHDQLKARASVIENDGVLLAFLGIDTCVLGNQNMIIQIRSGVEKITGIPSQNIMIGASHGHAAGPLWDFPVDLSDSSELIKKLAYEYSTNVDPLYLEWVTGQSITAISEAFYRMQNVKISIGSGHEANVAYNRRIKMKNGRTYTHPGKTNPDNLEYAGPIDPEVGTVAAWDEQGNLLGCIVNFSCHCTNVGGEVSSDYVGYMEKTIQGAMNKDAVTVFLNGACGDITQVDNLDPKLPERGHKYAKLIGTSIAAEALKVMVREEPGEHAPLAAASKMLRLDYRKPSQERLKKAREIVEAGLESGIMVAVWTFAKELLMLEEIIRKMPKREVEIQALQIGETVFVATPAEFFCQLGLDIKKGSKFMHTYVVELANGCVGYIPSDDAFLPTGGGYETVLTAYSNLEIHAGSKVVAAAIELVNSLTPGVSPKPEQVSPEAQGFATSVAWDYGILGPDLE